MESDILEVLLLDLLEERLNKIVRQDKEYCQTLQTEEKSHDRLENMLTTDQQEALDDFLSLKADAEIIIEKTAYTQGMKDMYTLFKTFSQ